MSTSTRVAFRDGTFVPYADMAVGFGTHALHYGTSVFEGLRAYWDGDAAELYLFRPREHFERLRGSARFFGMTPPSSTEELCRLTTELLVRSELREDAYVRPVLYKGGDGVGLWRSDLPDCFAIFAVPMGKYIGDGGIRCCVSSWRRPHGNSAPARAKIGGMYAAMALARHEALEKGFDEAILLSADGRVAEGSAENIFLVFDGKLVTPSLGGDVLAGITRASVIELAAAELGLTVVERDVNQSELTFADEVFLCGTAAEITPVVEIDHRVVGDGTVGPVTQALARVYDAVVHGRRSEYLSWCRPVYAQTLEGVAR